MPSSTHSAGLTATILPGVGRCALLVMIMLVHGCGGGGGTTTVDPTTKLNEASCTFQYELPTPVTSTGTDPLLANQWHLDNTGQLGGLPGQDLNAFDAWASTRGAGVRAAVVDDAIEVTHRDLLANVVPDASFNYRTERRGNAYPLPCFSGDTHGTAVAGIIAADRGNALGGSGVAPEIGMVGYNALATGLDSDIADALNRDLQANGIYHNSWGAPDNGVHNASEASFQAAIDTGLSSGRGGKGAIYVFPAGNGGCYSQTPGGNCRTENSNYDGYVNKLGIITACAVDNRGTQPFYGEIGANILVCGPSSGTSVGITTTDVQNAYRDNFSGTSASTPMVSGVVALMLSVNPELTWRDVQQILARSARKNDPADTGWTTNFGLNFNPKYGFGVVDAKAAIDLAAGWSSVGNSSNLLSCGPFTSAPGLALPDPSPAITTVSDAIAVSGCAIAAIEFIELRLTTSHSYDGDLRIDLLSPNGLISPLATERACQGTAASNPCGAYNDWPFGLVRHLDEPSNGNWTLRIADAQDADTGQLVRWSLRFYGR
ncbi:MAG: S8 family peptidase [Burkholderiaceae bacterium]